MFSKPESPTYGKISFSSNALEIAFVLCAMAGLVYVISLGYKTVRESSAKTACIMNLRQIESAKAQWATEFRKPTNAVVKSADLFGTNRYIWRKPQCPMGGVYRLHTVIQPAACTLPDHKLE